MTLHRLLPVVALALLPGISPAEAASAIPGLPNKTVVIIVPNAAGGPSDILGRLIAPKLGEAINQSVIVDNRPSNNGVLAGELASRAAADGSVLAIWPA